LCTVQLTELCTVQLTELRTVQLTELRTVQLTELCTVQLTESSFRNFVTKVNSVYQAKFICCVTYNDASNLTKSSSVSVFHFKTYFKYVYEQCSYNHSAKSSVFQILKDFISVIKQLNTQNFCFTICVFHACTCFQHMCSKHVEAWNKLIAKQKLLHQVG